MLCVANVNLLDVERIRHFDLTVMNKATAQLAGVTSHYTTCFELQLLFNRLAVQLSPC
jgi:hypothetical protein